MRTGVALRLARLQAFSFNGEPQAQAKLRTDACGLPLNDSRLHRGAPDVPVEATILQQSISEMSLITEAMLLSGRTTKISNSPTNTDLKHPAEQALILITARVAAD